MKKSNIFAPLKARDAFVGGRTEIFYSYWHKGESKFNLKYVDVCSLYPYVNAHSFYPVGHPDQVLVAPIFNDDPEHYLCSKNRKLKALDNSVYSESFTYVENCVLTETFFGLIKCVVLAPRDLLIPVLPFKHNKKLFFPLCKECVVTKNMAQQPVEESNFQFCSHTAPSER